MPTEILTFDQLTRDGVAPTFAAIDPTGNSFSNNGRRLIYIKNTAAGSLTVNVAITKTVDGQTPTPIDVVVPATNGEAMTSVYPLTIYSGTATITYSGDTSSAEIAVIETEQ